MRVAEIRRKEQQISCPCLELDVLSREVCLPAGVVVVEIDQRRKLPKAFAASKDGVGVQPEALALLISEQFVSRVVCDVEKAVVALEGDRP